MLMYRRMVPLNRGFVRHAIAFIKPRFGPFFRGKP